MASPKSPRIPCHSGKTFAHRIIRARFRFPNLWPHLRAIFAESVGRIHASQAAHLSRIAMSLLKKPASAAFVFPERRDG